MTALIASPAARRSLPASGVGGWLREGVARRHGRRRNPARTTPRSSLRPPTNQAHHSPQAWCEKVGRSIKGSDTPQARDFVAQVKRTRDEAELVPIRLTLLEGEYLDEERYGVGSVASIDAFPVECRWLMSPLPRRAPL